MSARPIGYYVHHQGEGHLARALAVARAAPGRFVLLGTGLAGRTQGVPVVELPDDRPKGGEADGCLGVLHYAPQDHEGVRARVACLSGWIAEARPALVVADVSVEVAMLARLASTPSVCVRLNGRRTDAPHLEAFLAAEALLAPFAEALDDEDTPAEIRRRTFYAPGLTARAAPSAVTRGVLVVIGRGGEAGDGERWADAARATPDVGWTIAGLCSVPVDPPPNLERLGWVADVPARIAAAEVVVGAAGDGLVGAVFAARRPFVCVPEPRPFEEQVRKAARLATLGVAVVHPHWPAAAEWPNILERVRRLDTSALAALDAADGPARAAAWLTQLAERCGGGR